METFDSICTIAWGNGGRRLGFSFYDKGHVGELGAKRLHCCFFVVLYYFKIDVFFLHFTMFVWEGLF